jgi:hypothetical protein
VWGALFEFFVWYCLFVVNLSLSLSLVNKLKVKVFLLALEKRSKSEVNSCSRLHLERHTRMYDGGQALPCAAHTVAAPAACTNFAFYYLRA